MKIEQKHIPAHKVYTLSLTDKEASKLYSALEDSVMALDPQLNKFVTEILKLLGNRDL